MGTKPDSKSNTSGQFCHKLQSSCPLLLGFFPITSSEKQLPLLTAWHPTALGCETLLQVFFQPEERTIQGKIQPRLQSQHWGTGPPHHEPESGSSHAVFSYTKIKKEPIKLKIRQFNETEYAQAMSSNCPVCRNKAESQCSTLPSANSASLQSALLECYLLCARTRSSP